MRCLLCDCDVHDDEPSISVDLLRYHAWCARGFVVDVIRALRSAIAASRTPSGTHENGA
jgi:hypothetical protein